MHMFLLIDIGNTKTKWVLRDNKNIYEKGIFLTRDIDQDQFKYHPDIKKVYVANVAGFEKEAILKIKFKNFSCPIEFVKPQKIFHNLINQYEDVKQRGVDRWLSALAVAENKDESSIIVTMGTAVTIDLVLYDKKLLKSYFEGGIIMPGLYLNKEALSHGASDLKHVHGSFKAPATNTADAIESGFILGVLGSIQWFIDHEKANNRNASVVISGGDADLITSHLNNTLKNLITLREDLVLEGLFKFISH
jgi:type III pantothenate kinase